MINGVSEGGDFVRRNVWELKLPNWMTSGNLKVERWEGSKVLYLQNH